MTNRLYSESKKFKENKEKLCKEQTKEECPFTPKINVQGEADPKYFMMRLEKWKKKMEEKSKKNEDGQKKLEVDSETGQKLFHPKVEDPVAKKLKRENEDVHIDLYKKGLEHIDYRKTIMKTDTRDDLKKIEKEKLNKISRLKEERDRYKKEKQEKLEKKIQERTQKAKEEKENMEKIINERINSAKKEEDKSKNKKNEVKEEKDSKNKNKKKETKEEKDSKDKKIKKEDKEEKDSKSKNKKKEAKEEKDSKEKKIKKEVKEERDSKEKKEAFINFLSDILTHRINQNCCNQINNSKIIINNKRSKNKKRKIKNIGDISKSFSDLIKSNDRSRSRNNYDNIGKIIETEINSQRKNKKIHITRNGLNKMDTDITAKNNTADIFNPHYLFNKRLKKTNNRIKKNLSMNLPKYFSNNEKYNKSKKTNKFKFNRNNI